jgi:branched-chain amino acid transport system substrate-binding protein
MEYAGSTGKIAFDDKGDRKDAEMTIFTMKDGKLAPIAIIKGGKTISYDEFVKAAAAPAPAAPAAEPKKGRSQEIKPVQ